MSDWTPERQTRYRRAKRQGTLSWRCLLCRRAVASDDCPHSLVEHREAVKECATVALIERSGNR